MNTFDGLSENGNNCDVSEYEPGHFHHAVSHFVGENPFQQQLGRIGKFAFVALQRKRKQSQAHEATEPNRE